MQVGDKINSKVFIKHLRELQLSNYNAKQGLGTLS